MSELKQAIAYLEDGIKETDNILAECSPALQAELLMQRGHYEVAIRAMRRAQPEQLPQAAGLNPCTMSTERAAELLQESFDYMSTVMPAERRRPATAELLNAVAVAISTLRAQPDNAPLTLEELRGMVGSPVWVTHSDGSGGRWGIVNSYNHGLCADVGSGMAYWFDDYIGNVAYRRKPEPEGGEG